MLEPKFSAESELVTLDCDQSRFSVRTLVRRIRLSVRLRPASIADSLALARFGTSLIMNRYWASEYCETARFGPDEWALSSRHQSTLESDLAAALPICSHSIVDISQRDVGLVVSGTEARQVINTACALDLRDASFPAMSATRTLFGKIQIVLIKPSEENTYYIECSRSYREYLLEHLAKSARSTLPLQ